MQFKYRIVNNKRCLIYMMRKKQNWTLLILIRNKYMNISFIYEFFILFFLRHEWFHSETIQIRTEVNLILSRNLRSDIIVNAFLLILKTDFTDKYHWRAIKTLNVLEISIRCLSPENRDERETDKEFSIYPSMGIKFFLCVIYTLFVEVKNMYFFSDIMHKSRKINELRMY